MKGMSISDKFYIFSIAGWIVWALGSSNKITTVGFVVWLACFLLSILLWEDK